MAIGPVEYLIMGFPGNKFTGRIAPELARLVDSGTVRLLDLTLISKHPYGNVVTFEFDQLDELAPFADVDGEIGGLVSAEDIDYVGSMLEPNSSAAVLVWEDRWAAPLVEALRAADGIVLEGARIP